MKICAKCKIEKDDNCFSATQLNKLSNGLNSGKCKVCVKEYSKNYHQNNKEETNKRHREYYKENKNEIDELHKIYYEQNKDQIKEYQKKWYQENINEKKEYNQEHKEEKKEYNKKYYQENKKEINEQKKEYQRKRRENDLEYKLKKNISRSVYGVLKHKKGGKSVLKYLPYTMEELKKHIEDQFEPWMTWENWGKYNPKTYDNKPTWNLDHIEPHSHFNYDNMDCQEFRDCWALSNLRPLSAKQNIAENYRR